MFKKNKRLKISLPCSEIHYIANSDSEYVYSPYLNDLPIKINQEIYATDFYRRIAILRLINISDGLYLYRVVNVHC